MLLGGAQSFFGELSWFPRYFFICYCTLSVVDNNK